MTDEMKIPPYSEEAEIGVIGCCLLDADIVFPLAVGKYGLTEDAFYLPAHRILWSVMTDMSNRRRPIDILTVAEELKRQGLLDRAGGPTATDRMIDATPTAAHADRYCEIVRTKASLRRLISTCRELEGEALQGPDDPDALVCQAPERMMSIIHTPQSEKTNLSIMGESVQKWRDASDGKHPAIGLETPWRPMTFLTCGFEIGVTIIAGRPSAGKTTLENQCADFIAANGTPGYRVTLDSTRQELLERSICREAGISLPKMKFGFGTRKQHQDAEDAAGRIGALPLHIDDKARDISQIRARARALKAKSGIRYLTVDYIQLVRASDMGRSEWDAVTRVTHVSSMLKDLAFELEIPVIVLCQLSRAVEKEGRDPQLSDLRDSGAIEQDASKVIFLYVDLAKKKAMEEKEPGSTKHKRPVICNVMKHKNGETGVLPMWLYPPYFRFHPAKFDPESGAMFMDDALPSSRDEDEQDLRAMPAYMPKSEQVQELREEQSELGMKNDD